MKKHAHEELKLGPRGLYRALWRHAAGDRPRLVAFMAMLLSAQLMKLSIPYFSGAAVNAMQRAGGPDFSAGALDMALIFLVCLASWVLHGPARVMERFVAIRIRERFADALYAKAVRLPLSWHERNHSGETIQRVEKAGNALFGFAQHQFVYLQNAVSLIGPIVALFVLSVPTGLTAVAAYAIIAAVLIRLDVVMVRLNREQNRAERHYSAALVDCLGNIATVLTLRLEGATRRLVGERLGAVFAPLRSSAVLNEVKWCVVDVLNNAIRCGLVVLYVWLAYRNAAGVMLGSAVMVYQYAQQVGGVVSNMAGNYHDLVCYETDLAGAEPLAAAAAALAPPSGEAVPAAWREIAIEGLTFSYAGSADKATLGDVSLRLARGRRIALVGESGSGKSTLLRVLAGLYQAQAGAFLVDGRHHPGLADLASIATLVPQDPEIFAGSIGHNVTLGLDRTEAEIRRACELAGFAPVVDQLPEGLETDIAQRGLNLSGGQKQRLALARGILAARGSSLVMLDEPTSSLDPATEAEVYDKLPGAFPEAAILSSVHRLHLLTRFHEVVLMRDGRILAVGSAAELLAREPHFQMLWRRYGAGVEPIAA